MYSIFFVAIIAVKLERNKSITALKMRVFVASNQDEAFGMAMREAEETILPLNEGWYNHRVNVADLQTVIVDLRRSNIPNSEEALEECLKKMLIKEV